jgi:hypothetical protein
MIRFRQRRTTLEKRHFGAAERLWIAGEIDKLLPVARDANRSESQWADNLIRNAYLWYWTADGINAKGKVKRDLFKRDTDFLRHTDAALNAKKEGRKVTHEHAVPRKVLLQHLKSEKWDSPSEIKAFLDRFCFGVIIDKEREDAKLRRWKQKMPTPFSADSKPLERYKTEGIEVREPKYARSE